MNANGTAREIAQKAFDAWQTGERDGKYDDFLALLAPREAFVLYSHPTEKRGVLMSGEGWDALKQLIAGRTANPNHLTFSSTKVFESDDAVAFQFDSKGRVAGLDKPYNGYNVIVFTIKSGKVVGFREYLGSLDF